MCGICGFLSKRNISKAQLAAMNDTMAERGPDDAGVQLWELPGGTTLGLAQRRLSILDLSPLGHQPMSTPGGRVSLVYNGEIYNYREIRDKIPEYHFLSNCDTEVILAAYLKWGIDCISQFNGMFAIALYDHESGELYLSRDRAGQKPLYYWLDGENVVFSSVLAPIMVCPGFSKRIRRDVLPRYLYQEYICEPDTIFEDVYKVPKGGILRFGPSGNDGVREKDNLQEETLHSPGQKTPLSAAERGDWESAAGAERGPWSGRLWQRRYWSYAQAYRRMRQEPVGDYAEAKASLKALLQASVCRRMIADVPLGTFLSGGYDSSLVSAIAQEQLGSSPLATFSIGFEEKEYDESPYARAIAQHLGTDHTALTIRERDMLSLVDELPKVFDEPMADSSQIPTLLVSALARRKVTVSLSGDAGDEFYCGYSIYDRVRQAQRLDIPGAVAHCIGQIPAGSGKRLEDHYPFRVRVISANRCPQTKTQFGGGSYADLARSLVAQAGSGTSRGDAAGEALAFLPVNYEIEDRYPEGNWQITRMLLDMDTYLPDDILVKVDRASMHYSLESRCPFLDPEVMEYSFRIDHGLKYHREGGAWSKKYILKQIAYDYIPRELLDRPKKGFSVPLSKWLRGPLRDQLLRYADTAFLTRQGLFDPKTTADLTARFLARGDAGAGTGQNYSRLLWSFFIFQQWCEYWNVC